MALIAVGASIGAGIGGSIGWLFERRRRSGLSADHGGGGDLDELDVEIAQLEAGPQGIDLAEAGRSSVCVGMPVFA